MSLIRARSPTERGRAGDNFMQRKVAGRDIAVHETFRCISTSTLYIEGIFYSTQLH